MNKLTLKEYNKIKNKSLNIISFCNITKCRLLTYSNVNYNKTIQHIKKEQKKNRFCLIVENLPVNENSYDFVDYLKYL